MHIDFDSLTPIYLQIAGAIEDDIITGKLKERAPVYSQLVLSRELKVNPATAAKGINVLVQKGILEKQRGLSMTVVKGAQKQLVKEKRETDFRQQAKSLVDAAQKIGLTKADTVQIIENLFTKPEGGGSNA